MPRVHEELAAMGAIASGGVVASVNGEVVRAAQDLLLTTQSWPRWNANAKTLPRREALIYRNGRSPIDVRGKIAILVDDGLATGSTMRTAVTALRQKGPARESSLPCPWAPASTCTRIAVDCR